jgi:membrane protein DedA with SNARE-associated domain
MTVLAGIAALAMATCVGYYFGRRAGSTPSTWRQRTSRIALGRLAITLLVSLTARRIRRSFRTERMLAPLDLLRGSVARMRSY